MAKYTWRYEQRDFGTERELTVFKDGKSIGARDPFWNAPMYVKSRDRKRRMLQVAREIIADHEMTQAISQARI